MMAMVAAVIVLAVIAVAIAAIVAILLFATIVAILTIFGALTFVGAIALSAAAFHLVAVVVGIVLAVVVGGKRHSRAEQQAPRH